MNRFLRTISAVIVTGSLSGCLTSFGPSLTNGPNELAFGLGGAALGGWAGSMVGDGTTQLIATAGGAVLGAAIGGAIGSDYDDRHRAENVSNNAVQYALRQPPGTVVPWNDNNGNTGTIVVVAEWYDGNGRYCRQFEQRINGHVTTNVACMNNDTTWELIR